ncbi:MAG: urease accessory protein UreD [Rhodobacteraceae bacterium HLUCCA08]|nr:MAG: urease accessory protein UreD [Rhodobacteraceae bacterium HLUCCA08]
MMLSPIPAPDAPAPVTPPRARGRVLARFGPAGLERLRQEGCLRALFPGGRPAPEMVTLNTAGGLTGGDRIGQEITVTGGGPVTVTTQAAERAYRAAGGRAEVAVTLEVRGAALHWLPQETILYDGAALRRRMTVALDGAATALIVEPLVLGRRAMGERCRDAALAERWELRRDGRLVFADALRLAGDLEAQMARPVLGGGAGAMASVLFAGPGAAAARARLGEIGGPGAGVSLPREDVLFARVLAADGHALRARLIPMIEALGTAPLPKVWRL